MKVINITNGKVYENYVELFQELSNDGVVISVIEDGKIIGKKGEEDFSIEIGEISTETKDKLIFEVSEYKDSLRESVTLLKKQGLITKEAINKLGEQFAFMNSKK